MSKTQKIAVAVCMTFTLATLARTASAADREVVAFRLANWKTVHFDDTQRADAHANAIKRLGCEVRADNHGDHIDVSYRCTEWREILLDSHSKAHEWEDWLKSSGFETRHAH